MKITVIMVYIHYNKTAEQNYVPLVIIYCVHKNNEILSIVRKKSTMIQPNVAQVQHFKMATYSGFKKYV